MAPKIAVSLRPVVEPMEALSVDELPAGPGWQYEPKWDGFRCLAFRDGDDLFLQSKSGQPFARYFPEVVAALLRLKAPRFVLDGELVVPVDGRLSFDALLQRIHPAVSRVQRLAEETPALFIAFDLLATAEKQRLFEEPLAKRRATLERFAKRYFRTDDIKLSPATTELTVARKWWKRVGDNLDGLVCKRLDLPYRAGLRDGMAKVKKRKTADCVVGGFRYASKGRTVGSLLLGLYDDEGKLNHVGFTSAFAAEDRPALTRKLEKLAGGRGFTGRAPGGPSRWSTKRSSEWEPLKPKLVVEVEFDHFTGDRFRHGTRLIRWRPDKKPTQCTMDQVEQIKSSTLKLLDLKA
jgi:ATP-dependent DNA ligase